MNDFDDHWLQSAITNDDLVVHILLNLRHASQFKPKTWTIRQRRSRPPISADNNKSSPARASPTTPLSWSRDGGADGGASVSGGVEEETSRRIHHASSDDALRSKVILSNETTPTKRPRKKKTLAELKEDEMTLLKERKQLKRQLATLQATCQKHREENESLKRMKNDMNSQQPLVAIFDCRKEQKNDSFALPDLNIPAGEDY